MLRADMRYDGEITSADWMESNGGTPGLSVNLDTPDGDGMSHVFWASPKALKGFKEQMKKFGFTEEQLASGSFMQHELPGQLVGREVTFGTKSETYNNRTQVKVHWIGPRRAASDERGIGYAVAAMFGGKDEPEDVKAPSHPIADDDIPF
jgi:hypothetical protein